MCFKLDALLKVYEVQALIYSKKESTSGVAMLHLQSTI